jgi:polysaccharide pyruvyl transferase WcaK-like protein
MSAKYLHMFDHVFVRSTIDLALAIKEIGSENATYARDAAMSIPFIPRPSGKPRKVRRIGLCLAQPLFNNNPNEGTIISNIVNAFSSFQSTTKFEIILLPFNTHELSTLENDKIISEKMSAALTIANIKATIKIITDSKAMLEFIGNEIDLIVCMRYHSVVFSAMTKTPFVALYMSQKIDSLLTDLSYDPACCYKLPFDDNFLSF